MPVTTWMIKATIVALPNTYHHRFRRDRCSAVSVAIDQTGALFERVYDAFEQVLQRVASLSPIGMALV